MKLFRVLSRISRIPYLWLLLAPSGVFCLGIFLNMLVMGANHAQMPFLAPGGVCPDLSDDIFHSCMTASTHFKWLADWMVLKHSIASPGDFFIWGGDAAIYPGIIAWGTLMIKRVLDNAALLR
jgi:hypothetical protein